MLEYENQMFLEVLQEDGLLISAKGLGLETVFTNILKVYLDPGNLVIVLGTTDEDEKYFIDQLKLMGQTLLPKIVTAHNTSNEREIIYLEGGVLFLSGRILVVDLLKNRVPLHLVTGMLVYRAHGIMNSYQEAFALRLYRQTNKAGFIKAFSSSALAFTFGFAQVERIMKALFVKKLYLWPRFHSVVNSSLSKHKPQVIELHAKLTQKMSNVQTALLDIMNFIVKELKRLNKYLDLDDLTVENAIAKKFHKQLQVQLDPIWHQLGSSTKQLVADLKLLGYFLTRLTQENCIAFYALINRLRTSEFAMKGSGWLILDAVDDLFTHAKSRVYNNKNELKPEPCPKWNALNEILNEISIQINKEQNPSESAKKVLILVNDGRMAAQLKNFLTMGAGEYLLYEAMKSLSKNELLKPRTEKVPDKADAEKQETEEILEHDSYVLTFSQKPPEELTKAKNSSENSDENSTINFEFSMVADFHTSSVSTTADPIVLIQSIKRGGDPMALQRTLYETMPGYVIMYGTDISSIRQLEVYQNNNPSISLKIFFLVYGGSVEEQGYLTALRREKEAFDKLINTKTTMVVPTDQDGKSGDNLQIQTVAQAPNSRQGGLEATNVIHKVIVDIREFRSELPALLHKRGIEIEPITLVVGDYIVTPEICIERKSISDLIMSLNSGRLYNQAVSMTRHYTKPMLLIEFDQNKSFCLQGNYYVSRDMKSSDVTAKLQLLTMHFPKLKIVWSPSPQATAQLFEELKHGKEQPNAQLASQIGLDEVVDDKKIMGERYNMKIQDFVAKLPGVTSKNLRIILNQGVSLENLVSLTKEELEVMIGHKTNAQMLYSALHDKYKPEGDTVIKTMSKAASKVRSKGLFSSKK